MNAKNNMKITSIQIQTMDALELSLAPLKGQIITPYKPGQHITVYIKINNIEHQKTFYISSNPNLDKELKIIIEKIQGEKVSNYIHQSLSIGEILQIGIPKGNFIIPTSINTHNNYYLIAEGSGITPILSLIINILSIEKKSKVNLLYGTKNEASTLFYSELESLKKNKNFTVQYLLSHAKIKWSEIIRIKKNRTYKPGRIDKESIQTFLKDYTTVNNQEKYLICGPKVMVENTHIDLRIMGIQFENIIFEHLNTDLLSTKEVESSLSILTAQLHSKIYHLKLKRNQTILSALIQNKCEPPYSCEGGICGTCQCKLNKGSIKMKMNSFLTDEEIADGYILACQAIATSDEVEVNFD